jgi:hypothetical protein
MIPANSVAFTVATGLIGGSSEFMNLVVMFHAPSLDSNLKTKGLTLVASLQFNIFNALKFGSLARIRTKIHGANA